MKTASFLKLPVILPLLLLVVFPDSLHVPLAASVREPSPEPDQKAPPQLTEELLAQWLTAEELQRRQPIDPMLKMEPMTMFSIAVGLFSLASSGFNFARFFGGQSPATLSEKSIRQIGEIMNIEITKSKVDEAILKLHSHYDTLVEVPATAYPKQGEPLFKALEKGNEALRALDDHERSYNFGLSSVQSYLALASSVITAQANYREVQLRDAQLAFMLDVHSQTKPFSQLAEEEERWETTLEANSAIIRAKLESTRDYLKRKTDEATGSGGIPLERKTFGEFEFDFSKSWKPRLSTYRKELYELERRYGPACGPKSDCAAGFECKSSGEVLPRVKKLADGSLKRVKDDSRKTCQQTGHLVGFNVPIYRYYNGNTCVSIKPPGVSSAIPWTSWSRCSFEPKRAFRMGKLGYVRKYWFEGAAHLRVAYSPRMEDSCAFNKAPAPMCHGEERFITLGYMWPDRKPGTIPLKRAYSEHMGGDSCVDVGTKPSCHGIPTEKWSVLGHIKK